MNSTFIESILISGMINNPSFNLSDVEDSDSEESNSKNKSRKEKENSQKELKEKIEELKKKRNLQRRENESFGRFRELSQGFNEVIDIRSEKGVYEKPFWQEKKRLEKLKNPSRGQFGGPNVKIEKDSRSEKLKSSEEGKKKEESNNTPSSSAKTNPTTTTDKQEGDLQDSNSGLQTPLTPSQKRRLRKKHQKEKKEKLQKDSKSKPSSKEPSLKFKAEKKVFESSEEEFFDADDSGTHHQVSNSNKKETKDGNGNGNGHEKVDADGEKVKESENQSKIKANGKGNGKVKKEKDSKIEIETLNKNQKNSINQNSNSKSNSNSKASSNLTATQKRRLARKKAKVSSTKLFGDDFDPISIVDWNVAFKPISKVEDKFSNHRGKKEDLKIPRAEMRELNEKELNEWFEWENFVRKKNNLKEERNKKEDRTKPKW